MDIATQLRNAVEGSAPAQSATVPPTSVQAVELGKVGKTEGVKGKHGGARPGGGRKTLEEADKARTSLKRSYELMADEEMEIVEVNRQTGARVSKKVKAIKAVQTMLLNKAVVEKSVEAAKELNNRWLGHPKQPIVGDDDEPPVQFNIGFDRVLDRVYGVTPEEEQ